MSIYNTVREALIAAEEAKLTILREQGEIQFATRRLVAAAFDLKDVIWRLQYELEHAGLIDKFGDQKEAPPVHASAEGGEESRLTGDSDHSTALSHSLP